MYIIVKNDLKNKISKLDLNNVIGYKTSYTNSKLSISIKKLVIYENFLYENIINEKLEQKFRKLIEVLINLYENETDDGSGIIKSLNEIERFKQELKNKYKDYMNKKQKAKTVRKITIMEEELKQKLLIYQNQKSSLDDYKEKIEDIEEIEKDVHRSR